MTIDEKLQHFYEVSLEEAREDAAQAIQEHKKLLSEKLEEHRQLSRQNAEAEVKAETEHVRREVNKALSADHSQKRLVQKAGRTERSSFWRSEHQNQRLYVNFRI